MILMMLLVMMTMGGSYPVVKGQEDFNSTFFAPDITSNAEIICPDSSNDTFNIVLLGETGVGKSTFGNYLLGVQPSEGFKVGGGAESVTLATETKINRFLGNATNFCVSVTDTPGLGDTECRDEEHMKGIIEAILDKQRVDLFVWIFRGTDNRFDSRVEGMIKMFEKVLGEDFYKNMLIEFTFFRHDPRSRLLRARNNITMEEIVLTWDNQFKDRFNLTAKVPAVFIDPLFLAEISEATEKQLQEKEIFKLEQLLKSMPNYDCKNKCRERLSLWHQMMRPEILTLPVSGGLNEIVQLRCSIWLESKCRAENQSSYDNLQWSFTANKTAIFLPGNSTLFNISQIIDESFPIKTSVVEFMLQDVTEGSFQCHHGEHASNIVNTTLILGPKSPGYWTDWSNWGQCTWRNGSRVQHRHRHCIPPKNRGRPCLGDQMESRHCQVDENQELEKCFYDGFSWSNDGILDIIRDSYSKWSCRSSCLKNPQCLGYTWFGSKNDDPTFINVCNLFSSLIKDTESVNGSSGKRECSCSVPYSCSDPTGSFFDMPTPTEKACMRLCAASKACQVYTWYNGNSFARYQCYLYKSNDCKGEIPCQGCLSGPSSCINSCGSSETLNEESRNIINLGTGSSSIIVERSNLHRYNSNWIRIGGLAGDQVASSPPPYMACGTRNPIWFNGTLPKIIGSAPSELTQCYVTQTATCQYSSTVTAKNCGDIIYQVQRPRDESRFCGEFGEQYSKV